MGFRLTKRIVRKRKRKRRQRNGMGFCLTKSMDRKRNRLFFLSDEVESKRLHQAD